MITDSSHHYLRVGLQAGRDRDLLMRALSEASRVESDGLASVLTLKHLAWQTGASYRYLRQIVQRGIDPYSDIFRKRRNGTQMRLISAPDPPLMAVQRWILRHILQEIKVHPASCAYMPGNSIVDCAQKHLGASWLIKIDISDFFHSINERKVFRVFRDAGYNRLVAFELARICTRRNLAHYVTPSRLGRYTEIPSYRYTRLGALPQGGPTSGALANIVMYECDVELSTLAIRNGLVYTRYADDMTFSAGEGFTRQDAIAIIASARQILRGYDFIPRKSKTRICPPGSRRMVLGLLVDGDHVRLNKDFRRQLDAHIRGVERFGLSQHARYRHFTSIFSFINHVNGLLSFASNIDAEYSSAQRTRWNNAMRHQNWPLLIAGTQTAS